jgi:alanyl-tRNA synthetase
LKGNGGGVQTYDIRKRVLDHFVKAGHTEVPSASVVLDDPNLPFVNAGMVQFRPFFRGSALLVAPRSEIASVLDELGRDRPV